MMNHEHTILILLSIASCVFGNSLWWLILRKVYGTLSKKDIVICTTLAVLSLTSIILLFGK